ncbi:ATP-binding cassette domain-containing protein [Anaerococcus sp. AGMB00486]|uniref:ATP-binding cassette domain-containing protein n=1 Tax=Anaerococcus faecalis TaxID=2742993 RepID=A0ABX2N930_9FIRM|nr:ATP-binding cassette domain-containing protein [Anaerococcus faecalis]
MQEKKLNLSTSILYESMFALNLLSAMLIILFASILVSKGHISLKELIASITLVSISTNAIAEAFRYTSNVFSTKEIKNLVLEKLPKKDFIKKDKLKPKLDLNIKNLDFSYDNNKIFSNLSIDIKENKSYAIIGKSGSGKSSLAKILMKINENYKGDISFDNGDFRDFSELEIYSLIYYIPQNPIVFNMNLLENIVLGSSDYDRNEVLDIIKKVDLDYLLSQKKDEKLDSNSLSGGEKKKLEIARAIYKNAKLIIFDEPQTGLDPKSSQTIDNLIFSMDDITRIVITHKQDCDYLNKFDRIINIEDYK